MYGTSEVTDRIGLYDGEMSIIVTARFNGQFVAEAGFPLRLSTERWVDFTYGCFDDLAAQYARIVRRIGS